MAVAYSCTGKMDIEEEKKAIIAVIEEETAAFVDRDFDRLAACYVMDETNIRLTASKSHYVYHKGWKELSASFKNYFENYPEPEKWMQGRKQYAIKVYPECAWVVFENEGFLSAGSSSRLTGKAADVRFLEKHNGEWKIVYLSHVNFSSYDSE